MHLSCTVTERLRPKDIRDTTLTFWSHVTSLVTWALNSAYVVFNCCFIETMRLSCNVTEILDPKDIGVTTLTFWGHVTSSVTWPLDLAHVVFYWWSIGTLHLSCTVTEILDPKDIKIIDHVTIGLGVGTFLLVVNDDNARIYGASKILGSRLWPFGVTWHYRSRDHQTWHMWFPTSGLFKPCAYLA